MKSSSFRVNSLLLVILIICSFYCGKGFFIDSLQATVRQYLWKSDVSNRTGLFIRGDHLALFPNDIARRQVISNDAQFKVVQQSTFNASIPANNSMLFAGIQLALLKNSQGPIYLLNGTQRWPITAQNFDKYGFDKTKILNAQPSYIYYFTQGQTI